MEQEQSPLQSLLNTRYSYLATNTIDYWMLPDNRTLTSEDVLQAITKAPALPEAALQIYIHVPFCAQHCRFCAFSGGNSLNFRAAERYARLVVWQLRELLNRTQMQGHQIRSVNLGGGAPDLLQSHVGSVLSAVRELPGCDENTELSVELTLSTTKPAFIEELVHHEVTKASFGVQTLDEQLRRHMCQPPTLVHLDRVLTMIDGRIPIINADLITRLPGQTCQMAMADLHTLMEHPAINAISSYLLTPGAAPSLVAGLATEELPPLAPPAEQAYMRLHTYATFLREGWVRKGTNTYMDPRRIPQKILDRIAGNECIGTRQYEDCLLGIGPQAVSCLPGARVENTVDINEWCAAAERGQHAFCLPKCSTVHQKDIALWVFPLRFEGLPAHRYERMVAAGAMSAEQLQTLNTLVEEGLVLQTSKGYELSIVGEVFMGHLVRELKQPEARRAVEDYIAEGLALGEAVASGHLNDSNRVNNRQLAQELLTLGLPDKQP